jgi:hypothetical protein
MPQVKPSIPHGQPADVARENFIRGIEKAGEEHGRWIHAVAGAAVHREGDREWDVSRARIPTSSGSRSTRQSSASWAQDPPGGMRRTTE